MLKDEMKYNNISSYELSNKMRIEKYKLDNILRGKKLIDDNMALLLEKHLCGTADYWLELQNFCMFKK